ncbi:Ras family protein [Gregarina niphandrodes]|uniref:Ras family protein n=1 Tax=Gregarina niphandrodes TaxID=110365 RepID=A0A023B9P0_GRENI|nr:Ras family protein [Gregarina niphandrodes]EZG73996.1 Ras family protein [Gregarina niphandrodes]|eukprot:XP_011129638.1 Ras family protein [Gregarina niphandrodes]
MTTTEQLQVPVVRVTLLGRRGSGKTKLIDCFLNHTLKEECWELSPTAQCDLYYKLHVITTEHAPKSILVEIEDTPGSDLLKDAAAWRGLNDDQKLHDPVCRYISSTSAPAITRNADDVGLFNMFPLPWRKDLTLVPITPHRMGYMLVFDLTEEKTFLEAVQLHQLLKTYKTRVDNSMALIVYLAGTKCDRVAEGRINELAEAYATKERIPYKRVSGVSGYEVASLFSVLATDLAGSPLAFQEITALLAGQADVEDEDDDLADQDA